MRNALPYGLIAAVAGALYLPFLGNPPVFDDRGLYSGYQFSEHASSPFGLGLRYPAHFTFAFVEVMWGRIEAHRLVSLALHAGCGWALYALVRELQKGILVSLAAAVWFVAHPAAVYGAGYLAQRSIVMATLFSLLAILVFHRGLRQASFAGAIAAALLCSAAVLSKEHAILAAAAAVATVPLTGAGRQFALRYSAVFLAACLPAAILIVALARGLIGVAIEPQVELVVAEVTAARAASGPIESLWLGSALTQASMFFRYVVAWFWPLTSHMSIDLRIDFASTWAPMVAMPAVAGYFAWGAISGFLLLRRGAAAVAGFGLLYLWILFAVEFAAIRYQEPFVLYRSYLWAPGLAIAMAGALERLPRAAVAVLLGAAAAVLPAQSYDRLGSLSSGIALWEDAVAKLPPEPVPGGARPLYFLGREYLYADQPRKAVEVVERCIAKYPASADCQFARAAIHMNFEEYQEAVPYLLRAIALNPKANGAWHHLGWTLENLGCVPEARLHYRRAAELGFVGGTWRLVQLDSPGKGLIPPSARKRGPCPASIRSAVLRPG